MSSLMVRLVPMGAVTGLPIDPLAQAARIVCTAGTWLVVGAPPDFLAIMGEDSSRTQRSESSPTPASY